MGFGRRTDREATATSRNRLQFVGRHDVIEAYQHNFGLRKDHPDVQPITAISGIGGVGKSRLLDQLMQINPSETIYSRIDATDRIGDDITLLLQAIARNARLGGRSVQFQHTNELIRRRREMIDKITQGSPDVPKVISDLLFNGARLTAELVGGSAAGNLVDIVAPREAATQLLDTMFDRLAKLRQDKEARLLLEEPVRVLTKAFVEDLNDLGSSHYTVVLVFDDYETLAQQVNPWLLKFLLGECRDDIQCDLRLLIAGRDPLVSTDIRWHDIWRTEGLLCEFTLEPFTDEELGEFLRLNCRISDPKAIAPVAEATSRLPLWVALWAASGGNLTGIRGGHELVTVAERMLRLLPSSKERLWVEVATCCRWFNEDVLTAVLGREEAKSAFSWLLLHGSLLQPRLEKWSVHSVVGEVIGEVIRRRSQTTWRDWHLALAAHFEKLQSQVPAPQADTAQHRSAEWWEHLADRLYHLVRAAGQEQATIDLAVGFFIEALTYMPGSLPDIVQATRGAEASMGYRMLADCQEALASRHWASFEQALGELDLQANLTERQEAILLDWVGYSYAQRQAWSEAIKWYRLSSGKDQSYAAVLHDLSNALLIEGETIAAIEASQQALRLEVRYDLLRATQRAFEDAVTQATILRTAQRSLEDAVAQATIDHSITLFPKVGLTLMSVQDARTMEIHEIAASVRDMCSIEFGSQVVGDMFAKRLTEMLETRPDLGERLQAIIEESQTLASAKERANKRSKVVKVQLSPIVDTKRKRHNVRRR